MNKFLLCVVVVGTIFLCSGCVAIHRIGRQGVKWDSIEDTNLIAAGKSLREDVEKNFGEPNLIRMAGQEEIWVYHFERGFYIIIYGNAEYKDLIIRFDQATGVVKEYKYLKTGESLGFFVPPGGAR